MFGGGLQVAHNRRRGWGRVFWAAILLLFSTGGKPAAPDGNEVPVLKESDVLLKVLVTMLGGKAKLNRSFAIWIVFDSRDSEQVRRAQDYYEALLLKKSQLFPEGHLQVTYLPLKQVKQRYRQRARGAYFLLGDEEPAVADLLSRLKEHGAWVVARSRNLVRQGALFSVALDSSEQVILTINARAVSEAGLKLPPELIRLARMVRHIQ